MIIMSTTLTGNNEDIIAGAIRSIVAHVDLCLVIDTGVTDNSLIRAREVAREKYVYGHMTWMNDFSAARNFSLGEAWRQKADWAITVDTDERINMRGENLRDVLSRTTEPVLMMRHASGTYQKERCFKLPALAAFSGPTHESFPTHKTGFATFELACFSEEDKSFEQWQMKFRRDVAILKKHTREFPKDPRWHYYLGDSLSNLHLFADAAKAFEACAALRGWDEESAWACYRAAECYCKLEQFQRAVDACARGMQRHVGIGELAWLAAYASWQGKLVDRAIWWARIAITMGRFQGYGRSVARIGFRNLSALYEGPFDVLRFALRKKGDHQGAQEAEKLYHEATAARLAAAPG